MAWPYELARAWRVRVGQLVPDGATGDDLVAAEVRAHAELSPDDAWRSLAATWPPDRRDRLRMLALELAASGLPDRLAFQAIVSEDDPADLPSLDPTAVALAECL